MTPAAGSAAPPTGETDATAVAVAHNSYYQAFEQHAGFVASETPAIVEPIGAEGGQVDHRVVTYRELVDGVNRVASALAALGVRPGDRVLLMVPMSTELYQAILAVLKMGAVCLFVDPSDGVRHLDRCAASLTPRAFIGVPRAHVLRLVSGAVRRIPIHVSTWPTALAWTTPWSALLARGQADFPTAAVRSEDPAMISFTSGSSGVPKGVVRSHRDLRTIFAMLCGHEGKQSRGVNLCAFPVLPLDDLSWGRTSLLPCAEPGRLARLRPADLASQLRQFPPATLSAPPSILSLLADHCRSTGERFPSVRHVFTGGGVVPMPLIRELTEFLPGARLHVLYGSTEAEPVSMISGEEILGETAARTEAGEGYCAGRIAPDTFVAIVEPTDGPLSGLVPAGGIGEVLVSGPHVNRAYWRDEALTRLHKFHDPATGRHWHRMGDAGRVDEHGRLWIVGRLSERIVTPAATLYPGHVEPLFDAISDIRKTALVGIPVRRAGRRETIAALLVEFRAEATRRAETLEEIRKTVRLRGLPIEAVLECPAILKDRRIGAKVQYAALAKLHGPAVRDHLGLSWWGAIRRWLGM